MAHVVDIARKVGEVQYDVVEVTPEIAQFWLETNNHNRTLRAARVDEYAEIMAKGQWRSDREPIEFTPDGDLMNGQHRLNGVIKTGLTVHMPVKTDTPKDDMTIIDGGLSRQPGDDLAINGYEDATQLAAAAKVLMVWRSNPGVNMLRSLSSRRLNREDIQEFVSANPDLLASVKYAKSRSKSFRLIPPSAVAAMHYEVIQIHGREVADQFFESLLNGIGLEAGSPILALRNALLNSSTALTKPPTELRIAWTIVAFNKWLHDEQAQIIRYSPKTTDFPTIDAV